MGKHGEPIRVGKTFGKFTVIEEVGLRGGQHHWICRCECGKTLELSRHVLRSGARTDCGCSIVKPKKKYKAREDLTGRTFNRLTVLGPAEKQDGQGRLWDCACKCGGNKTVRGHELKRGAVKSCGCLVHRPFINLAGKTFGKLTVLSRAENFHGATMWKCRCECGTLKDIQSVYLRNGTTTNCGCSSPKGKVVKEDRRRKVEDLTGKRFGMLTVSRRSEKLIAKDGTSLWVCKCECGKTREVSRTSLKTPGRGKSCGCERGRKAIDLTRKKIGRLKVVSRAVVAHGKGTRKNAKTYWHCVCECGSECSVSSANLRHGMTRSCGCLRARTPDTAIESLFKDYQRGSESRDYKFNLTKKQFGTIIGRNCFYCGAPPTERKRKKKTYDGFAFNGVDRLNNSLGYSVDNCVAACKICNTMKATHAPAFFLKHIKTIYQNKFQKNPKPKTPNRMPNQKIIEF